MSQTDLVKNRVERGIVGEPGHYVAGADTNHLMGWCDECDLHYAAGMSRDQVENWYHQGVFSQDVFEAYMHVWATSATRLHRTGWETPPEIPRVTDLVTQLRKAIEK